MQQRAIRLPSRTLVQVITTKTIFDATIVNLSAGGARLLGVPDDAVTVGEQIKIQGAGKSLIAKVRWNFDDTCGLMFVQPLSATDIITILDARAGHQGGGMNALS